MPADTLENNVVKICLVTDIHHGENNYSGVYNNALPLIKKFNDFCDHHKPDYVIELGDRINDSTYEKDFELASEVANAFSKNNFQVLHINGNHDRDSLSFEDNSKIFNQKKESEFLELETINLAVWRAESKMENTDNFRGIHARDSDLEWLSKICRNSNKPLLIFSHIPLSGRSQIGNIFFENNEELSKYARTAEIRDILTKSLNATFCFSGHIHQNTYTQVDGTFHFTQQSLTETFATEGKVTNSMGLIEIDENLKWTVFGNDQIIIEKPINVANWVPPINKLEPKNTEVNLPGENEINKKRKLIG